MTYALMKRVVGRRGAANALLRRARALPGGLPGAACLAFVVGLQIVLLARSLGGVGGLGAVKKPFAAPENGAFWSKHFFYSQNVPWDEYALSLYLECADHNITRDQISVLNSYLDENRDGRVTLEENRSFLIKFGEAQAAESRGAARDGMPKHVRAVRMALSVAEASTSVNNGASSKTKGDSNAHGVGCAIRLDPENKDYLEVAMSGNLQFRGDSPFTIEVWVKPREISGHHTLISKYNRGKWGQYFLKLLPTQHVFFHREVAPWGQEAQGVELPLGVFSHVAAVYGEEEAKIYINGTLARKQEEGAQDNNNETPVLFGAMLEKGAPIDFFDGDVDEIRFWDVERTEDQIATAMHLMLSGTEDGLVAYWPLDEW